MIAHGIIYSGTRYVLGDEDLVGTGGTWIKLPCLSLQADRLLSPTASSITITVVDKNRVFINDLGWGPVVGQAVQFYSLTGVSQPYTENLIYTGVIESAVSSTEYVVTLTIAPMLTLWNTRVPKLFSPLCRYTNTTECPYALSCAKSWTACTTNGRTNYFGGFRRLVMENDKIIFREQG